MKNPETKTPHDVVGHAVAYFRARSTPQYLKPLVTELETCWDLTAPTRGPTDADEHRAKKALHRMLEHFQRKERKAKRWRRPEALSRWAEEVTGAEVKA